MFCTNCGSKLSDDACYCPNCGITVTLNKPQKDELRELMIKNEQSKRVKNVVIGIIIAILGFALMFSGVLEIFG